ncbi:hypothetical protein HFP89_08700 [Wenzhouxiangella sp. XN79A]|uniref:hypothetical protein n=1 Tax=Wenzhouxiangella sp. XN79A TaxID=2724193 RepID=UPI00144A7FBB|nr:hypothetical protein [Wenzhouxiangella sp. XN79A]NKI35244.1 hypothetical protein [Wenzhouxiangella sp. XN79A]
MNRSPDSPQGRPREALLEDRIIESGRAPADPELAADVALHNELCALEPVEPLPPALKRAVLERTVVARSSRTAIRGLPVALAAGLAGLLALTAVLRPSEPEPLPAAELELALATLESTSRDALGRAGREVGEHLEFPVIELEQLPYGHLLRSLAVSTPRTYPSEEN